MPFHTLLFLHSFQDFPLDTCFVFFTALEFLPYSSRYLGTTLPSLPGGWSLYVVCVKPYLTTLSICISLTKVVFNRKKIISKIKLKQNSLILGNREQLFHSGSIANFLSIKTCKNNKKRVICISES